MPLKSYAAQQRFTTSFPLCPQFLHLFYCNTSWDPQASTDAHICLCFSNIATNRFFKLYCLQWRFTCDLRWLFSAFDVLPLGVYRLTVNPSWLRVSAKCLMQWFSTCGTCTTGGTWAPLWWYSEESPPCILTLWWYLERQRFSEVVLCVKRLRTTL